MKKLFLDDVRTPEMVWRDTIHPLYEDNTTWVIVKSYEAFVSYIDEFGLPDIISFDHDLSFDHYKEENQREIEYDKMEVKTGYHAAQWLIDFCKTNARCIPECMVHSMNKVGKRNIELIIENFKNQ